MFRFANKIVEAIAVTSLPLKLISFFLVLSELGYKENLLKYHQFIPVFLKLSKCLLRMIIKMFYRIQNNPSLAKDEKKINKIKKQDLLLKYCISNL